jgi:hypothetical protein
MTVLGLSSTFSYSFFDVIKKVASSALTCGASVVQDKTGDVTEKGWFSDLFNCLLNQ